MTDNEIKKVLLGYRPGSGLEQDPEVARALRIARENPALRGWLEQQTAFQERVKSELRQTPVPVGLRDQILAREQIHARRKIVPVWQRRDLQLVAASVAVLLVLSFWWLRPAGEDRTWTGFESRMLRFASREYRMDILTENREEVRKYLSTHGAPADFPLPSGLADQPVKGGARLSWQAQPVAMICFALPGGETIYLFVIDQAAVPQGAPPPAEPQVGSFSRLATAVWSRDGRIYVLAAPADESELRKLLSEAGLLPHTRIAVSTQAHCSGWFVPSAT